MKIIIAGPKGSGKTTVSNLISKHTGIPVFETDNEIEKLYFKNSGHESSCREIFNSEGEEFFRSLEKEAVLDLCTRDWCIISTGGGCFFDPELRQALSADSCIILLKAPDALIWNRLTKMGLPAFYQGASGFNVMAQRNSSLYEILERLCDISYTINEQNQDIAHIGIIEQIKNWFMLKMFSPSTFGEILRVTTFGESHGKALGAVIDGLIPGICISKDDIQKELDRRRPGQSAVSTPRNESDQVEILSGIFEGRTTGTPLCMLVYNKDQDSSRYEAIRNIFRPGHADFTFWKKYGIRDHRGGGRSSGRETIGRVAAGSVAKKFLEQEGITITAYAEEIGGITGDLFDKEFIEMNPVRAADRNKAPFMEEAILKAKKEGDSLGGIVHIIIEGIPAGLGDPVFFKLDAKLAMAFFSIGAVKGVEIGAGFEVARMKGSENNDPMSDSGMLTNNAGGILGGISTGETISARIAVKPTPSIFKEQKTITSSGENTTIRIEGRHDPCIVPRVVPVIESMAALVICDSILIQKKIRGIS